MPSAASPPINGDLPRQFASRDALNTLLAQEFPGAEGELSPIRGGREAAEDKLRRIDARRYAKSRNHLKGAGHRAVALHPPRRADPRGGARFSFARIRNRDEGGKLINELGWRDFWQRMWLDLGDWHT